MNFLPLVITFLLIFSALSISFYSNSQSDKTEGDAYIGSIRANRQLQNLLEEKRFEEKSLIDTSLAEEEEEQGLPIVYFRDERLGAPKGRVNLHGLIKKNKQSEVLYKLMSRYIRDVYGHMYLINEEKTPDFEVKVLKGIIKWQKAHHKKENVFSPLEAVEFEEPEIQEIYSKMLTGTNTYSVRNKKGYPPFTTLFSFEEGNEKPLNFHFANVALLHTLFDEKIAMTIEEQELDFQSNNPRKKKDFALTENALRALFRSNYQQIPESLLNLIDFSSYPKKPELLLFQTDEKSQITQRHPSQKIQDTR